MQLFLSPELHRLPNPVEERLAQFFQSEACKTLRSIARTHAAEHVVALAEHTCQNAVEYLRTDTVSEKARESFTAISQYSIFLKVLDEIETKLKSTPTSTIKSLTVDPE